MDPTPPDFRHYFRVALGTTLLATFLLASLNVLVDPYGMFRALHLPNVGYAPLTWSRVAAAERAQARCDVAIVGSSRVIYGFGTTVPNWGKQRVCNVGLGGTSIAEEKTVVKFIATRTRVKRLLLFVDLHMFNDDRGVNNDWAQSKFNPARSRLDYFAWGMTSSESLKWSTRLMNIWLPIFAPPNGVHASSQATRGMMRATLLNPAMYRAFEGPDITRRLLTDMLDEAKAADIEVMLAIPAEHALQIETLQTAGLWEVNKAWKRFLTTEAAARGIPLWDFETYHEPAKLPLPTNASMKPNPWWFDLSHQSKLLGDETLARIQESLAGESGTFEPRFGIRLTPENIEASLIQMDADRLAWRAANPTQITFYDQIVENMAAGDPGMWADLRLNTEAQVDGIVHRPNTRGHGAAEFEEEIDYQF